MTDADLQGNRILVIEDDPLMRKAITEAFTRAGAEVRMAPDGQQGLRQFYEFRPDLVTLDLRMPHADGWETLRHIRKLAETPVIVITALTTDDATVRALDMGAADFVVKPFSPKVLLARARVALRPGRVLVERGQPASYRDDYLAIDLQARRVRVAGEPVKLTKLEFELLAFLLNNCGRVLTYDQILAKVWGPGYEGNVDYAHVYMSRLRSKLEPDARDPLYLLSERGVGYCFAKRC